MDIKERIAREIFGICCPGYEFHDEEMYLGFADQIIPLVRADMQREIARLLLFYYQLNRKIDGQTLQNIFNNALKSGTIKEGE